MRHKALGNDHTDVAGSLTLLASLLIETRRYEEARSAAAEAAAICLPALGENHWRTAAATAAEGAAMAGLGSVDQAGPKLAAGATTLNQDPGALPFFVTSATRWAAEFFRKQGDMVKAAEFSSMLRRGRAR